MDSPKNLKTQLEGFWLLILTGELMLVLVRGEVAFWGRQTGAWPIRVPHEKLDLL